MTHSSPFARAVQLLLARALLTRADVTCLLHTSSCTRDAVLCALTADASLGREALPVAVEVAASSSTSALVALFLSFAYETHCRCPVPLERHALVIAPQDALVKRVVTGRRVNVALRLRDGDARGWGVVARERVPRGSFVSEYTGALVSTREMQRRFNETRARNYVLVLREVARQPTDEDSSSGDRGFRALRTIVDATACGNFTRLVNHSCAPNLTLTAVRVDSLIPRLVLLAKRDIASGEELTFDYAGDDTAGPSGAAVRRSFATTSTPGSSSTATKDREGGGDTVRHKRRRVACLCGAANCRRYLPSDPSI